MNEPINIAPLCHTHRWLLVKQTGFTPADPWAVLEVATQIALFQACTCDERVWKRLGGVAHKLPNLGCMACLKPDAFGEIVEAARRVSKREAITVVKELGERWIAAHARPSAG